jgi:hypothetical protein
MHQPNAIACMFVGLGALHVMVLASSLFSFQPQSPALQSTLSFAATAIAVVAARITSGWKTCDQSSNLVFVQHGTAILNHFPKGILETHFEAFPFVKLNSGSILLGRGDILSTTVRYLQVHIPAPTTYRVSLAAAATR